MGEIWYGCRLCVEHSSELSVTDRNIKMFRSRGQVSVWQSITVLLSSVGSVRRCLHVSDGGEVVGNVLCPNILFLCYTLDFCRSVIRVTSTPEGDHLDFRHWKWLYLYLYYTPQMMHRWNIGSNVYPRHVRLPDCKSVVGVYVVLCTTTSRQSFP